jgi:hypothetical protein
LIIGWNQYLVSEIKRQGILCVLCKCHGIKAYYSLFTATCYRWDGPCYASRAIATNARRNKFKSVKKYSNLLMLLSYNRTQTYFFVVWVQTKAKISIVQSKHHNCLFHSYSSRVLFSNSCSSRVLFSNSYSNRVLFSKKGLN